MQNMALPDLKINDNPANHEVYGDLLFKLETKPPEGLSRWDCPALAEQLGASNHAA